VSPEGELRVEATGETVGEAKWQALRELELRSPRLDKSLVRFQVVSEGERGLLGIGYSPARVVATAGSPPAEAREASAESSEQHDESPLAALVRELLERITSSLGVSTLIGITEHDDRLVASCSGGDLGVLIGRHGQTIDAIQHLVNTIAHRFQVEVEPHKQVVVDAAGYRGRRQVSLEQLAQRSAQRALESRLPVEFEPMSAAERKIVHQCLQDVPGVQTVSEGDEPHRFVVVRPTADGGG